MSNAFRRSVLINMSSVSYCVEHDGDLVVAVFAVAIRTRIVPISLSDRGRLPCLSLHHEAAGIFGLLARPLLCMDCCPFIPLSLPSSLYPSRITLSDQGGLTLAAV